MAFDWTGTAVGGAQRPDTFTGMNDQFRTSLEGLFMSAPEHIRSQLQVGSGFRSPERQAELWQEALVKYGSPEEARKWVAPPGNSQHNVGFAADLKYLTPEAREWAHNNAEQFGLAFPLSNEPWHIELAGDRGARIANGGTQVAQADTGTQTDAETAEGRIHRLYREGLLSAENEAKYIARFGEPEAQPAQAEIAPSILDAYNAGRLNPENTQRVADYLAAQAPQGQPEEPRSFGEGVLRQLGLTARAGAEGVAGLLGVASDPITGLINLALEDQSQLPMLQANVSNLLTKAGVPEPETVAERIAQTTGQLIAGGGGSVGIARKAGQVATGAVSRGVAGQMAAQPGAQIVGSGASGAASQSVAEAGGGEGAQLAAGLLGGVAGSTVTPRGAAVPTGPSAAQIATREAEDLGISVLTSDAIPPTTFASKWIRDTGERLPIVGTGGVRSAQQTQRISAIRNVLSDFGADYSEEMSDSVVRGMVADLSETRRAAITKYTTMKSEVFANVAEAGSVPMTNTMNRVDEEIARLEALNLPALKPAIEALNDWKAAFQGQDINRVEELRSFLGEAFKAGDLASTTAATQKSVNRIYSAVRDDIGAFIQENGARQDYNRWMVSNSRLSSMMGELDNAALKAVLRKGEATPETIDRLLFSAKRSDVETLYRNLSPTGRATARAAILNKAFTSAAVGDDISPARFATAVGKLGSQTGIFFNREQLQQVQGLSRALDLTRQANVSALNPPTGASLTVPVVAGSLTSIFGGPQAGLATAGTIGLSARAFESRPIRNALLKLSLTRTGSAEEAAALKRLLALTQTFQQENEQ